ncbi:site-specific integrase [Acidithiobacillus thiooxidans]|jgi:integrase|uniref:site-specific integrase n=1 Tax=Acidithiobacillus thiooxidans TaxID=930 RepID=UPI001C06BEB3|nr:site-specific integrase [Acidithiobacillus thiooxidans]MBU2843826.1 site-specific integrase [Acidithiobacillus thiooxidans]
MAGFYEQLDRDGIRIGWQAKIRKKGFPAQSKVFRNKADAQAWASMVEGEMVRGLWRDRSQSESTTLKECLERYLTEVTPHKKTPHPEQMRLRQWMKRPIACSFISAVRGMDVAEAVKAMEREGKSANTIRLHLAVLSHLFKVAKTEWGMEALTNPVQAIRKPKLPQGRDRRLEGNEEDRLLEACRNDDNPHLYSLVQFAIETAMRRGELCRLTWENINLSRRVALLPDTKNGSKRLVPLSTAALKVLNALPHRLEGPVWETKPDTITQSFARCCKRAHIEDLCFHDLRHEATSRLFEKGLHPMQVSAITGHKTLQMLKRYTHLKAEDLAILLG